MHNMSKIWFNSLRWNKKHFPWFFKGFQLPEIVSWKEDCCVIPQKRTAVSWDIVTQAWNFQLLLNSKSSKLSLRNFLKTSKLIILVLKKRGNFFQILLHVESYVTKREVAMFLSFRNYKETKSVFRTLTDIYIYIITFPLLLVVAFIKFFKNNNPIGISIKMQQAVVTSICELLAQRGL